MGSVMLLFILLSIINQSSPQLLEIKGSNNLSYQLFINQDELCFRYKLSRNWSEPTKLDSGDISEYAVAISPGNYIHVAYCKNQRVCYRTTLEPVTFQSIKQRITPKWSTWVYVSPYFTEPASNISIGIENKYLYVIWQSLANDNPKVTETWKRRKLINEPFYQWLTPVCLSKQN